MELMDSGAGTKGGQEASSRRHGWGDGELVLIFNTVGREQRLSEMHNTQLPEQWDSRGTGLSQQRKPISAPRPGQGDGGVGLPRPSFGLLLSPGWGPWVKGPLIPKPEPFGPESSFQSSASERLWPVGPGAWL